MAKKKRKSGEKCFVIIIECNKFISYAHLQALKSSLLELTAIFSSCSCSRSHSMTLIALALPSMFNGFVSSHCYLLF